jgi:hypothetical protein
MADEQRLPDDHVDPVCGVSLMPRNLDSATQAQTTAPKISTAFLLQITFKTGTYYLCTLPTSLSWNGQTWIGTGSLGQVGQISEGTEVQAYGTTVTLSGIDSTLLADSLSDIQIGAQASLYVAFFDSNNSLVTAPTCIFAGVVDQPSIQCGADTVSISLDLESEMIRLQRGSFRRFTSADQHIDAPGDTGFDWVPSLNFLALNWGG